MHEFVSACRLDDLPRNEGRIVEIGDHAIALFRVAEAVFAIDNACPHRLGPLGMGPLEGHTVACPLHAWRFDITTGACTHQADTAVATYPVRVENGAVLIGLPRQDAAAVAAADGVGDGSHCLVRYGRTGLVGYFRSMVTESWQRGDRVVIQTGRGVEAGEVLVENSSLSPEFAVAGDLLRRMDTPDKLQERALQENDQATFENCRVLLAARGLPVELVDVEQLLDGETIVFYFLGESSAELEQVTQELAQQYAARVQFHSFVERAEAGCGPGCGTADGPGCGDCGDGCGTGGCGSSPDAAAPACGLRGGGH